MCANYSQNVVVDIESNEADHTHECEISEQKKDKVQGLVLEIPPSSYDIQQNQNYQAGNHYHGESC